MSSDNKDQAPTTESEQTNQNLTDTNQPNGTQNTQNGAVENPPNEAESEGSEAEEEADGPECSEELGHIVVKPNEEKIFTKKRTWLPLVFLMFFVAESNVKYN